MLTTLLVAVGGLVGSVARYWLTIWVQSGRAFPFGTLVVNVLGSFVLGAVMTLSLERGVIRPELRIMLAAGFCGGFTTMSTFSYETLLLMQDGSMSSAILNVALTLVTCIGAVWIGALAGRSF